MRRALVALFGLEPPLWFGLVLWAALTWLVFRPGPPGYAVAVLSALITWALVPHAFRFWRWVGVLKGPDEQPPKT